MQLRQLMAIIPCSLAFERLTVNRTLLETHRSVIADDAGEHQRQDDLIIERELKDHDDCHDWRMGRGGEKSAHPNEGEGAWINRLARQQMSRPDPKQIS